MSTHQCHGYVRERDPGEFVVHAEIAQDVDLIRDREHAQRCRGYRTYRHDPCCRRYRGRVCDHDRSVASIVTLAGDVQPDELTGIPEWPRVEGKGGLVSHPTQAQLTTLDRLTLRRGQIGGGSYRQRVKPGCMSCAATGYRVIQRKATAHACRNVGSGDGAGNVAGSHLDGGVIGAVFPWVCPVYPHAVSGLEGVTRFYDDGCAIRGPNRVQRAAASRTARFLQVGCGEVHG